MLPCLKCKKDIPEDVLYCPWCGQKDPLTPPRQNVKHRGNGTGSVYQLKNKSWAAVRVVGYKVGPNGRRHKQTVGKYGFRTKREAMNALATLTKAETQKKSMTFQQLYDKWEPTHKASKSTMNCYHAAMNWFRPLWLMQISDVDIDDLQECVSECSKGKRTRENMKALCGLLYKYAIPRHLATLNMGQYLVVGGGSSGEKDALPMDAVDALAGRIGSIPFADYIVAQCYLGFRPSELLALTVDSYDREGRYFTGGAKTDAGRDRIVTVSPKIQPIIDRLIDKRTSGPVFPDKGGGHMSISAYRSAFYAALEAAGIENPVTEVDGVKRRRYTPHSCRHTFATLLKNVAAPDQDKLKLIGHTSTEMLRHYQDTDVESLRKITDLL